MQPLLKEPQKTVLLVRTLHVDSSPPLALLHRMVETIDNSNSHFLV